MTTKKGSSKEPSEKEQSTLLGQILVELGYITVYQLDESLQIQRDADTKGEEEHQPLGSILLELGYCTPNQLIRGIQVQVLIRLTALGFAELGTAAGLKFPLATLVCSARQMT